MITRIVGCIIFVAGLVLNIAAQPANSFDVIAYYTGGPEKVETIATEKLTHIIYSFCHLTGNTLTVDNARDSTTIKKLVGLKKRNPSLKIMLSLGGWGGCPSCSDVFASAEGRRGFTKSVMALFRYFKTDGLDLDWEYPAIEGYPGHKFTPEDRHNFTLLVQELRHAFGKKYELSFAAGGFTEFLEEAVEWEPVMKAVDRVNLMSYDLINGYATRTGHHTALFSRPEQKESTDHGVQYLIRIGVPSDKIVIGAAFYGRMWEDVAAVDHGLYQSGKFKTSINYNRFSSELSEQNGFTYLWDDVVKAPYLYNPEKKLFVTYDDKRSIQLKTQYVIDNKLGGIMFWELTLDKDQGGLLDTIHGMRMVRGK